MNPPPIPPADAVVPSTGMDRPRRRSRLALVAFVLALPAVAVALTAVSVIFGMIWEMPGEEAQPWMLALVVSTLVGFLAALLGSIPMVRMRGREPELRGRGLALFSVAGPRAVLFASGLAFGAIWVARQVAGEPDILRDGGRTIHLLWAVAAVLVAWYLAASVRRLRSELRSQARGWLLYVAGILVHVGLICGFPFCVVGAFMTLHEGMFVGQDSNLPQEPVHVGAYAQRELWLDMPSHSVAKATIRHWHDGQASELGSLTLAGTNRVRWVLAERGPEAPHELEWSVLSGGDGKGSHAFKAGAESTLVPDDLRSALVLPQGLRTNYWLFRPMGGGDPSKEGIELVLEPKGR